MTPSEAAETGRRTDGRPAPEATRAFELLSDETRARIVAELHRASGPLRFSSLCDRVGVADTGRFNYHLERLRGTLVEKTGEGYELTASGRSYAELLDCRERE